MTPRQDFHPLQAEEIARAFLTESVEYLFIGKSGAILLGYPGTTQDVDIFPAPRASFALRRRDHRRAYREGLNLAPLDTGKLYPCHELG
jgi:hypothetical protein